MQLQNHLGILLVASASAVLAACSSAGDPLGGPYGGTANVVEPNAGNLGSDDGGDNDAAASGDDAGASGSSGQGGSGSGSGSSGGSGGSSSGGSSSGSSNSGSSSGSSSGVSSGTSAPTWSQIFSSYLASGTTGRCQSCHSQMRSASGAYSWLSSQGYINGKNSILAKTGSCLTWFNGDMPPGGPRSYAQAQAAMTAWAAAGAPNN